VIQVRPARGSDVLYLAKRLADIDRLECRVFGHTPREALSMGLRGSTVAWTATAAGRPLAMFGVTPMSMLDRTGAPWLLGTTEARRHHRAFVELGRAYVQQMQAEFPVLENHVHRANLAAIRWLRRLGFTIDAEALYVRGEPMLMFRRGRSCAHPSASPVSSAVSTAVDP
jgi:hypothetical protein